MTMIAMTQAPMFSAMLCSSSPDAGTMFVSGEFDSYDLGTITDSARHDTESVRIRVEGIARDEAEAMVQRSLSRLLRRGVKVFLS
jgi:hypothetical protein